MTDAHPVPRFGRLLRKLRQYRGKSQLDLALDAEMDLSYVSMLESGRRTNPSSKTVQRLAEALNLSGVVLELFKREAAMAKGMLRTEEETRDFDRILQIALILQEGEEQKREEIRKTLDRLIKQSPPLEPALARERT